MKARPRWDLSGNVPDNLIRVESRHAAADDLYLILNRSLTATRNRDSLLLGRADRRPSIKC